MSLDNGICTRDIMNLVGVSKQAVNKRLRAYPQFVLREERYGTSTRRIYDPVVLSELFGRDLSELGSSDLNVRERSATRRARSDRGGLRKDIGTWQAVVSRVRALYLSSVEPNLRHACETAISQLKQEGVEVSVNVYARLMRKTTDSQGQYVSDYWRENWELLQKAGLRKRDIAMAELPTTRYDVLSLFESMGVCGPGFGFGRIWTLDGTGSNVWVTDASGRNHLQDVIVIRCGLTGYPMHHELIDSESKESVARAMLKCAMTWKQMPDVAVFLDNGRANISGEVEGLIQTMLPPEAWVRAEKYPQIFGRKNPSPVVRNLPNVPRSLLKAAQERFHRVKQMEHDATRFASAYQGSHRADGVQHGLSNRPAYFSPHAIVPTADQYSDSLWQWMNGEFLERRRPGMFPTLAARGITPTVQAAFQYYYNPDPRLPEGEQLAHLLWHGMRAAGKIGLVKAELGSVCCTIDGVQRNIISHQLFTTAIYRRKVGIAMIPFTDRCIVMLVDGDPSHPRYLGMAQDMTVRHADDLWKKEAVMQTQNAIRADLNTARHQSAPANWNVVGIDRSAVPALPQTARWIDEVSVAPEQVDDGVQSVSESVFTGCDNEVEVSSDTADLLNELNGLINP